MSDRESTGMGHAHVIMEREKQRKVESNRRDSEESLMRARQAVQNERRVAAVTPLLLGVGASALAAHFGAGDLLAHYTSNVLPMLPDFMSNIAGHVVEIAPAVSGIVAAVKSAGNK